MSLRKAALRVVLSLVALNVLFWGLMRLAPEVPDRYEGVQVAVPTSVPSGPTTTPPPLPSGFPSMELPPPKIEVPEGQPQPITTKFGLTYDIPADWRNSSTGIVSWSTDGRSVTYGAIGDFGYEYCPLTDGSTLADSGMTGRNGVDIYAAAHDAARQADVIFGDSEFPPPKLTYSDPIEFAIGGEPAVRHTVRVENIHRNNDCDPPSATFDVVATTGFATATVAVFMIELDRDVDGALDHSVADTMISSIRRSTEGPGTEP